MKMSQTLATKFSKAKLLTGGVLLATALSVGLPATSSATGMNGNFGRDNDFRMHNHRR